MSYEYIDRQWKVFYVLGIIAIEHGELAYFPWKI